MNLHILFIVSTNVTSTHLNFKFKLNSYTANISYDFLKTIKDSFMKLNNITPKENSKLNEI